jgi:hypothetical protein
MNELQKRVKNVASKGDFLQFMDALINDFKSNPEGWENKTLADYLSALQSWTEDMEGYYINNNLPIPENVSWQVFADILMAATMYE